LKFVDLNLALFIRDGFLILLNN
ncbi:MAG: hypothetical protein QG670_1563, partial [Thermoproteota archaeon]|nr:hypothetical protein [Thermoproteota archaeon]